MPRHTKRHIKLFIGFPITVAIVGLGFWFWNQYGNNPYPSLPTKFGVTFSTKYSKELGLDWRAVYVATLDDLAVKHYRIPVYWDEVESVQGEYELDDIRWMLNEAEGRDAKVTLAIGNRVPRWPECHPPDWTTNLPPQQFEQAETKLVERLVDEFKGHPALKRWQVENEPLFDVFGECAPSNEDHLRSLVKRVQELDPAHPVMITDSGELSSWFTTAGIGDVLGISMYRVTWNSFWGYFYYPLPPSHYTAKARLIKPLVDEIIISELQVEPWPPGPITITPLEEQFRSMSPERVLSNVDYARRTGFREVLLWGVEWWYWLREIHGDSRLWEAGRTVFDGTILSE